MTYTECVDDVIKGPRRALEQLVVEIQGVSKAEAMISVVCHEGVRNSTKP